MSEPDLSFLDPAGRSPAQTASLTLQSVERRFGTAGDRRTATTDDLVAELRAYQAELENQNKVLRYSQAVAESAYERFETLFASVPLALMVVDEYDLVVQANSMAHRLFQPSEHDRPLSALMPFVREQDVDRVREAFTVARETGSSEVKEVVFSISPDVSITGDLHIAHVEAPQDNGPPLT